MGYQAFTILMSFILPITPKQLMKEEIFGDTAIGLYNEDIVSVRHFADWEGIDDIALAKVVMNGIRKYIGTGEQKGLLITAPTLHKKKEVLMFYQNSELNEVARALLIFSFPAKIIGNMYLKIAKNKANEAGRIVPAKLFTDRALALAWLQEQVDAYKSKKSAPQ